jgi:glycosyltransferase involved in cell wall biosynthesis
MACEVPVVASRVGGLGEVVEDGVTGFLHPPDDVDAMAASGVRLLTDAALHREFAVVGRRRVAERFCTDLVVPMYEAFYERLVNAEC